MGSVGKGRVMRELLSGLLFIAALMLIFAWMGDVDAVEIVKEAWGIILDAVSQLGDAWREH